MSTNQFGLLKVPNGDIFMRGGAIIDTNVNPTRLALVGYDLQDPFPINNDTNNILPAPILSGGSGRNLQIVQTGTQTDIPFGTFFPISNNEWVNHYGGDFTATINATTGTFELRDATDIVATASVGKFTISDRAQCSLAQYNGGPGVVTKIIDLGTATGSCSFAYNSTGTNPATFEVEWNSITQISNSGTGTASFTKSSASPSFAVVTVTADDEECTWDYNLGCPGGGSPPYNPTPPGGGEITFTAASTTYGRTLNGGVAFNITCRFENGEQGKTLVASSYYPFDSDINLVQDTYQRYYDSDLNKYEILIKSTGAEFRDNTDVIAIKAVDSIDPYNLTDPSGTYESTSYGETLFELDEPFSINVTMNQSLSITGVHAYQLFFSSGIINRAVGPLFIQGPLPTHPTNTRYIPIGIYDSTTDTLIQTWEGPILFRQY